MRSTALASPFHSLRAMLMPLNTATHPNCHASLLCSVASLPNQLAGMTPWAPPTILPCTPCTCRPSLACTFTTPPALAFAARVHCTTALLHNSVWLAMPPVIASLSWTCDRQEDSTIVKRVGRRSHAPLALKEGRAHTAASFLLQKWGPVAAALGALHEAAAEGITLALPTAVRRSCGGSGAGGLEAPQSVHRRVRAPDHASDCPTGPAPAGRAGGRHRPAAWRPRGRPTPLLVRAEMPEHT